VNPASPKSLGCLQGLIFNDSLLEMLVWVFDDRLLKSTALMRAFDFSCQRLTLLDLFNRGWLPADLSRTILMDNHRLVINCAWVMGHSWLLSCGMVERHVTWLNMV
jgi:hypothetical protein